MSPTSVPRKSSAPSVASESGSTAYGEPHRYQVARIRPRWKTTSVLALSLRPRP
jgi:hypothetical protein